MSIESDLFSFLKNNADISAIVGERIYPLTAPQGIQPPYITYQSISTLPENTMSGSSGLYHKRIQFNLFASVYEQVVDLFNKLTQILNGLKGTIGNTCIGHCFLENDVDDYQPDEKIYQKATDFHFLYSDQT